ncbi:hypothetical protein AAZV13_13G154950 [Glycine max]
MIRMSGDDFEPQIFKCAVTRVKPYMCTMPLRMDEGWNQIHSLTWLISPREHMVLIMWRHCKFRYMQTVA